MHETMLFIIIIVFEPAQDKNNKNRDDDGPLKMVVRLPQQLTVHDII